MALLAASCSKESKSDSEKSAKSDESSEKCKYLPLKDASKIMGHPMKNVKQSSDECEFETDDSDNTVVKISIRVRGDKSLWDNNDCSKGKKVSGIDDEVRHTDMYVCVHKGESYATVYAMGVGIEKEDQEQMARIAKRVSDRMK